MLYSLLLLTIIKLFRLYSAEVTLTSDDWSTLSNSLDGYVVLPTDDSYEDSYKAWTATYDDVKSEAIVYCQSENDVTTAMKFIIEHKDEDGSTIEFAVRSGKHNLAGWSTSSGIIIDVSGLSQLYISDDNTAIVGPGVSLSVFTKFAEEHDFTLPHGDCASVCFGGFLLGGGFGLISRTFGMGVDWIKSMNIVLPTGELVTVSADDETYSDLYWALKGAGSGNFGVITQYEMEIPSKKQKNPGLYLEISWDYSEELWDKISSTWNSFAENTAYGNHFAVYLRITPITYITKDYYIQLHGFWTGEQIDGLMVAAKLLDSISDTPAEAKIDYVSFEGWIESSASDRTRYASHCSSRFAFSKLSSQFFSTISTTLQQLIDYDDYADATNEDELTNGIPTEFLFIAPAGGAISNHASDESAFPWRDATYLFVVCARYMNDYENAYNFVENWIVSTMSSLEPYLSDKSFINFPDNNLANWQTAYYGNNYARLQTVKARYDPDNIFKFKFSIEQPSITAETDQKFQKNANMEQDGRIVIDNMDHQIEFDIDSQSISKETIGSTQNKWFSDMPLWAYGAAVAFILLSIAIIFKTTSKYFKKQGPVTCEYTPVNDQQISTYHAI